MDRRRKVPKSMRHGGMTKVISAYNAEKFDYNRVLMDFVLNRSALKADAEAQHGPVKVIMKDGKLVE